MGLKPAISGVFIAGGKKTLFEIEKVDFGGLKKHFSSSNFFERIRPTELDLYVRPNPAISGVFMTGGKKNPFFRDLPQNRKPTSDPKF